MQSLQKSSLTIYKNECFITRNSTSKSFLIRGCIIKGLTRYKETWYKYFPNSLNFGISRDHAKNVFWRAVNLPDMLYLTNVTILYGTNNICNDPLYNIAQCSVDIGVCFRNHSPKVNTIISGIYPRDECYSVNRILIKEINTVLKCKCTFHCFSFIEQEQGQIKNSGTLDPSLFYEDKLHLIQKGNIKLSGSIIKTTEDENVGQNTHYNEMKNDKHNQFTKTYKMTVSFKLSNADFPPLVNSTVSEPVSSVYASLSCTTASRSFPDKVRALSKASNKPFLGPTRFTQSFQIARI